MMACNFRPRTLIQAEVGCPLDHAPCGEHVDDASLVKHIVSCKKCKEYARDAGLDIDPDTDGDP